MLVPEKDQAASITYIQPGAILRAVSVQFSCQTLIQHLYPASVCMNQELLIRLQCTPWSIRLQGAREVISWLGDFPGSLWCSLIPLYIFLCMNLQTKGVKKYSHCLVLPKEQLYAINSPRLISTKICWKRISICSQKGGAHCPRSWERVDVSTARNFGVLLRAALIPLTTLGQNLLVVQNWNGLPLEKPDYSICPYFITKAWAAHNQHAHCLQPPSSPSPGLPRLDLHFLLRLLNYCHTKSYP